MPGFREDFIQKTSWITPVLGGRTWRNLSGQKLIMPFYHAISDSDLPHIKHLYPVKNIENFVKDLDFLLGHYQPIGYPDLQKLNANNERPKKPSFLLSFDDGLREFHDVITPILLRKGIPAICFLNSGFIDNADLFFRYKASLLIEELAKNTDLRKRLNGMFNTKTELKSQISALTYSNRNLLGEIAAEIGCDFQEYLTQKKPYLSSEQIEKLISQGFCFGGHSIDHPNYEHLDFDEQLIQTKVSMDTVCQKFNLNYRAFSFPFTDYNISKKFFDQIYSERIVDISFGCAGQRNEVYTNHFQRIAFEMDNLSGEQILNSELLYYILKQPFGKN